jgi:hypothetical protein
MILCEKFSGSADCTATTDDVRMDMADGGAAETQIPRTNQIMQVHLTLPPCPKLLCTCCNSVTLVLYVAYI